MNWFWRRDDELDEAEADSSPRGASRQPIPKRLENEADPDPAVRDWWWKPLWTCTALVLFLGGLWSASKPLWAWLDQPVEQVKIVGKARHLDKQGLADSVAANLELGLLQTDIEMVKTQVLDHPWVRSAQIIRDWPATLEIHVEEEVPVARWGEAGLLNHEGKIFWPELKPEYVQLPRLSGASENTEQVMSQFHDLNQMFRRIGLKVVGLNYEARGAWTLHLDNDIRVVIGRSAVNERLERFLTLYTRELAARADEIEMVDIRYANGVSVRWKPGVNESDAG